MRVGIILGCLGFGGAERVSVNLAKWLRKKDHEVSFYTTLKKQEKEYQISKDIKRYNCYSKNKIKLIFNMRKSIKKDCPDVILIMGTPLCVVAVPALFGCKIPYIVSERNAPKNHKINMLTRLLSRTFMKFAQAYVFQTNGAKECYSKNIQKRSVIIPNPVILDEIPLPYEGIRNKKIVAIGRYVDQKNFPMLIKAFSEFHSSFSDYVLHIYGEGPNRSLYEKIVSDLSMNDFIELKHSSNKVLEEIRDASIFVLSSNFEGMPNVLIEAMALGIPVISTDCPCGGPAELIRNNVNGILIPVGDESQLVKSMSLIANDSNVGKMMSKEAVKVRELLNIDVVGEKWELILRKTASEC